MKYKTTPKNIDRILKDIEFKVERWLKFRRYCQKMEEDFAKSEAKQKLPYWKQ